jgi:hypothetical protein
MLSLGEPLPLGCAEPPPLTRVVDRHGRLWFRSDAWGFAWFLDDDDANDYYRWPEVCESAPLRPVIERECPQGCGPMAHHDFHDHEGARRQCNFQEACRTCGFQESGTLLCKGDDDD